MKSYLIKSHLIRLMLPAVVATVLVGVVPARANVEGLWQAKDGGTVRIRSCGNAMCGTTVSPSPGQDSSGDTSPRSRAGVQVLTNMRPSGPNRWTGRLFNPEDGKTYTGNLIELGSDTIRIEGCVLVFCGGETLTRVKSSASAQ